MIKSLRREIVLAIQAKSGLAPALFVWAAVSALTLLTAFSFLCVAGYAWFALQFGNVFAALLMTGIFLLIALVAALLSALARRRARRRALLERAAQTYSGTWLFDPKMLSTAIETGRSLGWQRLASLALLGFLAAQWARERRDKKRDQSAS